MNGTGNGTFSPNKNISREQAATMLTRAANVLGLSVPNGNSVYFDDSAKISSWAMQGVVFISSCQTGPNRVMGGTAPSLFSPQGTYSREQAVVSVTDCMKSCPKDVLNKKLDCRMKLHES